jgi:hypothetical protein
MLQAMLSLLPRETGNAAAAFAGAGTLCGAALWLSGARFSRYIITLTLVAIGTSIGVALPRWCGWRIDGSGTAVGGAIILGASGYVLHRGWVGAWFGFVMAIWAALGTWIELAPTDAWNWPAHAGMNVPTYLRQVWDALPPDVSHALPVVCGAAFVIGAIPAMVWPRAGMVFLYSTLGATLIAIMGTAVVNMEQPEWLMRIPPKSSVQMAAIVLTIMTGAGLQWQMNFRKPRSQEKLDRPNPSAA